MIEVRELDVTAGQFSLSRIDFNVGAGSYAVLMGPTGSGKTTLLEAIAGLRPVRRGCVRLGGEDVTRLRPADRRVGYVPQDGALFHTMSVRDNLGFALAVRRIEPERIRQRVDELAQMLGIGQLLERRPRGLSGGEKQRVALGRALAAEPRVVLLDEPLSALDSDTRAEIHELIQRMHRAVGFTALHVTHNREDARALADTVLQMRDGAIVKS